MTEVATLPIELLRRRDDARPVNEDVLAGIAESIEQIGLINPIRVRRVGQVYEIIAGSHRYAACDLAGLRNIPCIVVKDDDLYAELAMIDENLMRNELSASERAVQTARRKAIYLELHPETAVGENQHTRVRQVGEGSEPAHRFTENTAKATGLSERAVQRDAERGEKVIPEVIELIRGTRLDTGSYLDKLKRLTPNDQVTAAKRDLSWERKQAEHPTKRGGISSRYAQSDGAAAGDRMFQAFIAMADNIVAVSVEDLILSAGRQRAVLGQRASGLAERMAEIMERLDR